MITMNNWDSDVLVEEKTKTSTVKEKTLMLYNDDVNSFEHVIECLCKYCGHNPHQAEQVAMIVHYNGKCDVKHGSLEKLKPIYETLLDNHLTCKIE